MKKLFGSAKLEFSATARLQPSPKHPDPQLIFGNWYKLVRSKSFMLLDSGISRLTCRILAMFSYGEGLDRQERVSRQFRILDQFYQAAKVMAEHFFDNLVVPF